MSADKAAELGLKPRARIITAATWGNEPEYMGVAPIGAIKKALERAGMTHRRRRRRRAQRGVRRAGAADRRRSAASTWTSSTRTAARSRSATRSG